MIEYKFDTQLLIEGEELDEDVINEYISKNFIGDCLLVVGDDTLIKLHFHTNNPGAVVDYCSTLGDVFDVVIENMARQAKGLKG